MSRRMPWKLKKAAMNRRVYNFGAGPAMLPEPILIQAQEEFFDWNHLGMSILEVGHRTPQFMQLLEHAENTLRELLKIPDDYSVLFLGGAARTQFSMIPLNFLNSEQKAAYIITGIWSQIAFDEARLLKSAYSIANTESSGFTATPDLTQCTLKANTSYIYYTPNETVNGVRFSNVPNLGNIALIADMTSSLLSEPLDVSQFGLIFAGAQKNIANAGLTVVIIRNDLLEQQIKSSIPTMLNYKVHMDQHSLYATPPVFNCYIAAKMFDWLKQQGGVDVMYQRNQAKSKKLYDFIDNSEFYLTKVETQARSLVNVCFALSKPELENSFLLAAQQQGLVALKGHRLVGGLRASLYNAMPMEGVDALIQFMSEFEKDNEY